MATALLSSCAGKLKRPDIEAGVERLKLTHDVLFGNRLILRDTIFPVYKSDSEKMIFLSGNYTDLYYGLVLDEKNCHLFDGFSGVRSQLAGVGLIKDTCKPFCANIEPKKICFEAVK